MKLEPNPDIEAVIEIADKYNYKYAARSIVNTIHSSNKLLIDRINQIADKMKEVIGNARSYVNFSFNMDDYNEIIFDVSHDFPDRESPNKFLVYLRSIGYEGDAIANKQAFMNEAKPMVRYSYCIKIEDVEYCFSYDKEGLPSEGCRVISTVVNSIVCDLK